MVPVPVYMAPVGECVINVDLFPDDPDDDPHWDERYRLLDMMVTLCTSALPEEQMLRSPLTPLPAAKEQRRLYLRFLECRQANELRAFVDRLSEEHYRLLLAGIQQARLTISGPDQVGVIQRIDEVHRLWTERHQS